MLLQIIITVFALFALSRSFLRFRKGSESILEFIIWIFIWSSVVLVVFFPEITQIPAKILGIGRGMDVLVYLSIVALFYSIYRIYAKIEKIEQDITSLVRNDALKKK
jgi:small membrane protein